MLLTRRPIDWQCLQGRTFQTTTGARFTVVRVTAKNVTIRPERGVREYPISIEKELEQVLDNYAAGRFLPAPAELLRIGVRAVQTSYAWGILQALLLNEEAATQSLAARVEDFAGRWRITELADLDESYDGESDEPPFIELNVSHPGHVYGKYHWGLSDGTLEGEVRAFGGASVLLLSYEGADEMDPAQGAGWLQLKDREHLTGEFLSTYGRLMAERPLRRVKALRSRSRRKRR